MTHSYFHTKLSRWRKRLRKVDAEASAVLLQRATGKTLGGLCRLSRLIERLGNDGDALMAAAVELKIRSAAQQRLFQDLQQVALYSRALSELADELFGPNSPLGFYWIDTDRFRPPVSEEELVRMTDAL